MNEDEEEDEEEELGHTDTYAEYVPSKCKSCLLLFILLSMFCYVIIMSLHHTLYVHCTHDQTKQTKIHVKSLFQMSMHL